MANITNEMWVAIIGACAATVGALISTISIILTNKNTKKLQLLENSKYVKTEISRERLKAYNKIIEYINSWYDIKVAHEHDYIKCEARRYLEFMIFESRLKSEKDIINEYNKVLNLSLEYFYLDAKSYQILKSLENYLSSVINCKKTRDVGNSNLFYYIVYNDIWEYIFRLSKQVNKFINKIDTLKFKQSNSVKLSYIEKYYYKTNFYTIYDRRLLLLEFSDDLKQKIMPEVEKTDNEIEELKNEIKNTKNKRLCKLINKKIKILIKYRIKLLKIKFSKKYYKIKMNNTYKMWMICKNCRNNKCILSNKDGDINEIQI